MDITGEHRIEADRERVWAALNDPEMLQACIPGCESIERDGDTEMSALITAAIGPVKARFKSRLTLENVQAPVSYTLVGDSKAGVAGFGRGRADVVLESAGTATILKYNASFTVGGKLAQVGSRLVLGATRKTAEDFFGNLARALAGDATAPDVVTTAPGTGRRWVPAAAVIGVLLLLWLLLR